MRTETVARLMLLGVAGLLLLGLNIACGGNNTKPPAKAATVTTTQPPPPPPPTFQQQRDAAVRFLRQLNQASNNLQDAFTSAGLEQKLASGNLLQINAALTTATQQLDGYQKQINEIPPPVEVPEAADLKVATLKLSGKQQQVLQQLRTAIQSGSQSEMLRAGQQFDQLDSDPDAKRPNELEQALLARFNIPDTEVSYRRPPQ